MLRARFNKRFVILALPVAILTISGATFVGLTVHQSKRNARENACLGHLTMLGVALHSYHQKYRHFPPAFVTDGADHRLHSWRVLLLEFIDNDLFQQYKFSEPWDGPNNRRLSHRMPHCYRCPNSRHPETAHLTDYVVVVGEETAFPGSRSVSLTDIRADRSSTILVVEASGMRVPWMEPRDMVFREMSFVPNDDSQPSILSDDPGGPAVLMADGKKTRLRTVSSDAVKSMLKISAGGQVASVP